MNSEQPQETQDPYESLRTVCTTLRSDLQITRQLNRGRPLYVVYDPVSFQAHRLGLMDYRVTAELKEARPLQDCFQGLVNNGTLQQEDEPDFYQFMARLDSLGLLTTSNQNSGALFERFKTKAAAKRKSWFTSWLFMTIPLANPDKFLDRTVRHFAFLFTKSALVAWVVALTFSLWLIINRWSDFVAPLNGILAVKNLLFMWLAFAGLKIWHELGHGFACKHFGGRVPEMGCRLIVGMPLAYVDATSAWGFPIRMHRIIVMLAGMYFESLIAIPAIAVWAFLPETFVGSCAYCMILMAGASSLLFNANPLLRYDGYFILSDMVGIPNLRIKARKEVQNMLKHRLLGLPRERVACTQEHVILITYGVASSLYFFTLILSISWMIAVRFQVVGLCLATAHLTALVVKSTRGLMSYLLQAEETEAVRQRARLVACSAVVGIALLLFIVPIPSGVQIPGVFIGEQSAIVRADVEGTILSIQGNTGDALQIGDALVQLQEIDTLAASETERMTAQAVRRHAHFVSRDNIGDGTKLHFEADALRAESEAAAQRQAELTIRVPQAGQLVYLLPEYQIGAFISVGDPVAKLVAGKAMVRAWLNEDQMATGRVEVGSAVRIRLADEAATNCSGIITSVAPVNAGQFNDLALTTEGEGSIPIDSLTQQTEKPLFQVLVEVEGLATTDTKDLARANLLLGRRYEPLGFWLVRHARQFVGRILAA